MRAVAASPAAPASLPAGSGKRLASGGLPHGFAIRLNRTKESIPDSRKVGNSSANLSRGRAGFSVLFLFPVEGYPEYPTMRYPNPSGNDRRPWRARLRPSRAGGGSVLFALLGIAILAGGNWAAGQQGWWMTEPLRLLQTNLRETDSALDPHELIRQVEEFPANTLLFSVGGIVAHYPTRVRHHYPSDFLPPGRDLVGEVLREAHRRGIRVIGRFDFSRARTEVFEAHPEWFFRNHAGEPVFDENGLHGSCINGGYYHEKALEILGEALDRYELDGLFFNWFGNLRTDYYGNDIGLCRCDPCRQRFGRKYGRSIPAEPDADYHQFMFESAGEVAEKFRSLIKEKNPRALFMTYFREHTDGIVSEADFYKWRPLPQWIYSASESVNRALNSHPNKMSFSLVMPYQEMRYRFSSVPGTGLRAFLYQNIAHGAFPAFVVLGTFDQPDRTALEAVRPVFRWHRRHEDILTGGRNAGRVILYARQGPGWSSHSASYRGFFRLLSELHVPFRVTHRPELLDPASADLLVIPGGSPPSELGDYLSAGGRALVAGTTHPGQGLPSPIRLWTDTRSAYMRIESHRLVPSLRQTTTLLLEGDYLELEPVDAPALTLIPPSTFGPPDKVSTLSERTDKPGLIVQSVGSGRIAYIPWDVGALYYRYGSDQHRLLVSDLVDHLLDGRRQLVTNAHPSVEITVLEQPDRRRTLVHLVNLIGHAGTTFLEAVEMRDLHFLVGGRFASARALNLAEELPLDASGSFVLPLLREHEVIVLEWEADRAAAVGIRPYR